MSAVDVLELDPLVVPESSAVVNRLRQAVAQRKMDAQVDAASVDSFPASDPPSWNACHALGAPDHTTSSDT